MLCYIVTHLHTCVTSWLIYRCLFKLHCWRKCLENVIVFWDLHGLSIWPSCKWWNKLEQKKQSCNRVVRKNSFDLVIKVNINIAYIHLVSSIMLWYISTIAYNNSPTWFDFIVSCWFKGFRQGSADGVNEMWGAVGGSGLENTAGRVVEHVPAPGLAAGMMIIHNSVPGPGADHCFYCFNCRSVLLLYCLIILLQNELL